MTEATLNRRWMVLLLGVPAIALVAYATANLMRDSGFLVLAVAVCFVIAFVATFVPHANARWVLLGLLAVFSGIMAFAAWAVVQDEIASWGRAASELGGHPVAKTVRPWMNGLARASRFVLLAAISYATFAVLNTTGRECRQALIRSSLGLLASVVAFGGYMALAHWVYLPSMAPPRADFANKPGSLTKIGDVAPDIAIHTEGTEIRLADLRGRVVLLNFFCHLVRTVQDGAARAARALERVSRSGRVLDVRDWLRGNG